jgi:hypothetical protein
MIWDDLKASAGPPRVSAGSAATPSSSMAGMVSTSSSFSTFLMSAMDVGGSGGKNHTKTSTSWQKTICITQDRYEYVLSANPDHLSNITKVTFLKCTQLPPIELLSRMTNIQHLSFTQCTMMIMMADGLDVMFQLQKVFDEVWSKSLETLTITDCPGLFCGTTAADDDDDDDGGENTTLDDTSSSRQVLNLSKLTNLRELYIVSCGRKTVFALLKKTKMDDDDECSNSTQVSPLLKLTQLHLPRNDLTSDDVVKLFRLLGRSYRSQHSSPNPTSNLIRSTMHYDLALINLLNNSIESLDFVHDIGRWCCDGRDNDTVVRHDELPLHGLRNLVLAGNPVMDTSSDDMMMDRNTSDGSHEQNLIKAASAVPLYVTPDIDGLSKEQIDTLILLHLAPQLHFLGSKFSSTSSALYSKQAQHLMNVNRSGGRLLLPHSMTNSQSRCSYEKHNQTQKKTRAMSTTSTDTSIAAIWPHVFERLNRTYDVCDSQSGMKADGMYFLVKNISPTLSE